MDTNEDFWKELKKYTSARIGLKRSGGSVGTSELLEFQLAHAQAKDAVHEEVDFESLEDVLTRKYHLPVIRLSSLADTKSLYLQRPDLGRMLDSQSVKTLEAFGKNNFDIAIVVGDGLSAFAIQNNIEPLFEALIPKLINQSYSIAPISLVRHARVAVGDQIGSILNCKMVIVFIGERPGLSSPDSLGIYMTYQPEQGLTDEKRNCISNVRIGGLPYILATEKLIYLITESFRRKLSGVELKDDLYLKLEE
jgi:ethanolamine ammonia-lyase small subunit